MLRHCCHAAIPFNDYQLGLIIMLITIQKLTCLSLIANVGQSSDWSDNFAISASQKLDAKLSKAPQGLSLSMPGTPRIKDWVEQRIKKLSKPYDSIIHGTTNIQKYPNPKLLTLTHIASPPNGLQIVRQSADGALSSPSWVTNNGSSKQRYSVIQFQKHKKLMVKTPKFW